MAKTYELTRTRRITNWLLTRLLRLGVPIGNIYLLTVKGRTSGRRYTAPVTLAVRNGQRYLVAPYGEVSWVRNARAVGEVTISRGRRNEVTPVTELSPDEAAPVLKQYVDEVPIVRPYFDTPADAPTDVFVAEAGRKAVFRLG